MQLNTEILTPCIRQLHVLAIAKQKFLYLLDVCKRALTTKQSGLQKSQLQVFDLEWKAMKHAVKGFACGKRRGKAGSCVPEARKLGLMQRPGGC